MRAKATASGLIQDRQARVVITEGFVWQTPDIVFLHAPADCLALTAAIRPSWPESLPDVAAFPCAVSQRPCTDVDNQKLKPSKPRASRQPCAATPPPAPWYPAHVANRASPMDMGQPFAYGDGPSCPTDGIFSPTPAATIALGRDVHTHPALTRINTRQPRKRRA